MARLPLIHMTAALIISSFLLLHAGVSVAQTPPTESPEWYYRVGGSAPLSRPPADRTERLSLSGSASLRLGFSCGTLDPVIAVENSLNNIGAGADNLMASMTEAASSAIAALPALILQRANPGLYDVFQNALLQAEERVTVATKSCEAMEAEIARGANPYAELISIAKGHEWQRQIGIGGNDPITAKQTVETQSGSNGVPWINGEAGGVNQPPMRMVADVVEAGYRINANLPGSGVGGTPNPDALLVSLWPSPESASSWVTAVLGETAMATCPNCQPTSEPGRGLLPWQAAQQAELVDLLSQLVGDSRPPGLEELQAVSAPGVAITRSLVEATRDLPLTEQSLITSRLAAELAMARTLERALMARRLLLSGRQVPEVEALTVAQQHTQRTLAELDEEIENLLFEVRARREIVSDTALVLLERAAVRRQSSLFIPGVSPIDPNPLKDGRIERGQ